MRLWHKDLISVLPKQQLLGQLRECVLIAKNIDRFGTPNHVLVNRIIDYPIFHFRAYCRLIIDEFHRRGYRVSDSTINKLNDYIGFYHDLPTSLRQMRDKMFDGWHDYRYLLQCFYNLQEKYDCGAISRGEYTDIYDYCCDNYNEFRRF